MVGASVVERLYFGRDDAERDLADGLLRSGFQETAAYGVAMSGRKMLVIGRKGVGKSAICVLLAADGAHPGGTVLITPDDTAGEEIRRFELQGLPGDTAKSLIWRYVFAVHAARHVVRHAGTHGRRTPKSVRTLRRFLKANQEWLDESLSDRIVKGVRGLQGALSLEAFGFGAGVELTRVKSEGARASHQLAVIEKGVAAAFDDLGCAEAHPPLLLLVDQLEQVWSAERESNSMVIGLLLAARHVSGLYGRALNCLLFLRSDIYDSLSFGEGDKFRSDELRITWTETELEALALRRAGVSLGEDLTAQRLWGEIFPRTVNGEPTVSYLFTRALPRPRDIIQYLNGCQSTAMANGHRDRILESDVLEATRQFSEWKMIDLVQEYLVAHPFLERLFPLFQNSGYVVTRTALETRFLPVARALHREFPAYAHGLTLPGILTVLYEVGFLGVRRGNDVVYSGGPWPSVQPHEEEFHIHPCFRAALGATTAAGLGVYNRRLAESIQGQIVTGDVTILRSTRTSRPSREFGLLQRVRRACRTILDLTGRADGLPAEVRSEISHQLARILHDAECAEEWEEYTVLQSAAEFFRELSARLHEQALSDGTLILARRLDEEARRLTRAEGGYMGGGSGDSY
ncbi:P-loop ATPase, Sll1717 family [Actinomadura rugatobispora]|uniref:P-loop ATPase, Sll1717 family n=1 Tax=Actinomadura rugatobispora TaxID=1994 RepID=A0ABW1A6J3_9ACTN|nr:hypothetical protein GCM10010200_039560 [Actinomadura rugatobispora]